MNKEIEKYLSELEAKGYSKDLRRSSERVLNNLQLYLQEAWLIKRWNEAEETHLNSYLVHLKKYTDQKASSLRQTVSRIRRFFQWLYTSNKVLANIAETFDLPKAGHTLPHVPTEAEISKIIEQCDTEKAIGVRNRSILETLYACGIRHGELYRLNMRDFDGRTLRIREGKGKRERIVPLTDDRHGMAGKIYCDGTSRAYERSVLGKGPKPEEKTGHESVRFVPVGHGQKALLSADMEHRKERFGSGHDQRDRSHLPPRLRDASSPPRSEPPPHPETARTREPRHDTNIHARRDLGHKKSGRQSN
ncbi:MAG: tyrosine-type recombinase/integrase [Acidobacteria bacterium]|nr:tyrosine-type recombinase/integrase [Acidobacteriota bacterium]